MADTQVPTSDLLDLLIADTQSALVQSSSNEAQVAANMVSLQDSATALADMGKQVSQDQQVVASAQMAGELQAQTYRLKAANAAGIDPTKASDFMLEQIGRFQKGMAERDAAYDNWEAKKSSKLLDDPVKWVSDLLELPEANQRIRFAQGHIDRAGQNVIAINNVVQATASTSMQIKESLTATSADSASRLAGAQAQQAAIQNSMNAVKYNSTALNASMNATKERLSLMYNLKSAQNQEFSQKMVLERFAQEKLEFDWRKDERKAVDAAKAEGKTVDQYAIDMINLGRAARGMGELTGPAMQTNLRLFKNGASKELAADYKNGERTYQSGNTFLGATPAESLELIKELPYAPPAQHNRVLEVLKIANDSLASNKLLAGSKDEAAKAKAINDAVAQQVQTMYASGTKDASNLFHVGDLSSYLTLQSVAGLPVTKKLLAPAAQAGTPMDDPKKVLDLAVSAVKKGVISSNDFADIATVYQAANDINIRSSNLLGFGIQVPNAGRNFFLKVQTFGQPLDLTNPTLLTQYMSKQLAAQAGADATNTARELYGRPGTPNAMRRLMQSQQPEGK